ncbi:hypothetical protein DPMN_128726 [Dreissena polymorpha]|uniref:NACHT domain-containing protein n=1 Tax=Dreissena polymorpha TaxID=45954 RepID=A0A9D4H4H5_DREPO|nr:hypothetical protein DPMN_128726 [Dreissena polymorpha]
MLIEHYRRTQSTVSVSPIWDGHDKPIHTVFVRPNLNYITIEDDGSRRKTDNEVLQYKDLVYKENKLNKRVIIQGEPGMGKTTLLSKFVLDWCEAASSESQEYSANFSDLETLKGFKFLFHLSLRDSPETSEVVKMIKTQLIDKMYADEDERKQVYTLLQHILKTDKCILCMDGLNEWTTDLNNDPFPIIATCHKQCVALITTRPWTMVDKRIKDSGIDLLIEVSGIMDKEQLVIFIIKSRQTNTSKSHKRFMSYVKEHKLEHFLASPLLLTLLVSVWINSQHFSGSLCEMNCILLDNLFRKATKHEGKFSHAQFLCLKGTNYIYPRVEMLNSLAKLAFECTFSSGKSLVFSKEKVLESLSPEHLKFSLQAGILSERYISSLRSEFSFLHETMQEFLAAFHIAQSNGISISSILGTIRHVLEICQVFMYLCGLDIEKANTLLDSAVHDLKGDISHGLSAYVNGRYFNNKISVFHEENKNLLNVAPAKRNDTETYDYNAHCVSIAILFQRMLIAGFKEAEASKQNVSYLVCNDFIFDEYLHDSELGYLKSMLMNNISRVRSLILQSNTLLTKEILTVLQMSKACLTRLMIPGHHELYRAFSDLKITELVLERYMNVPVLSDVIHSLSMLSYLQLKEGNLQDELCVPVALKHLVLNKITCSAGYLSRMLVRLSSLEHNILCDLHNCSVESDNHKTNFAYHGANTDIPVVHSELLSCDMTRITLYVENGSRDLYALLRGTSIGILVLSTTDDVSLAADILPTLSKLETLSLYVIWFKDRGFVQLPPTLKRLDLNEVKCSTNWFGSLLIKLASLHHQVQCNLFDAAVNNRYAEDGLDVSLSDVQSELLSWNMSLFDLFVRNGSRDLYGLLRGTSIGILALGTTDDVFLAADILPTLSKLETLELNEIWFKDRGCVQLPPTLKRLDLCEVKCSTEWFGSLLIKLSSLQHQFEFIMFEVTVNTRYAEDGLYISTSDVQRELLSCDMSRIDLFVRNGSRDLYELLRGTSIGILKLGTSDDVSLAADILPTLSKLETLYIWGTFNDRCAIQIPPTLQCISLQEGECSTEWLGSLFIKLSSLKHQVKCKLFDVVVNTSYAEDVYDASISDVRNELLCTDFSHVKLYVSNASRDLNQLLRGTSLGILKLNTTDDESKCCCAIV